MFDFGSIMECVDVYLNALGIVGSNELYGLYLCHLVVFYRLVKGGTTPHMKHDIFGSNCAFLEG